MKRVFIVSFAVVFFLSACKSGDKKKGSDLQSTADSLYQTVIDIHNEGMAAWMKIKKKKEVINKVLDSIAALPEKLKASVEPLKTKLNQAIDDLNAAYDNMDKWMPTLNLDSAKNDLEKRIDYFKKEKLNAEDVNQAIFNSLQKADSLLKAKFQ